MTASLPQRAPWWWYPDADVSDGAVPPSHLTAAGPAQLWVRAIDVDATPEELFAWVTQLRRAPYSYDWVDNFGRRSPQTLDRTLVDVAVGDSVMTIFTVTAVVPGTSMTMRMNRGRPTSLFGSLTVHYVAEPRHGRSRLVVEMIVPLPPGPLKRLRRYALAWGDLLMMRHQVKELKRLAESGVTGASDPSPPSP